MSDEIKKCMQNDFETEIRAFRNKIDTIDKEILSLISERLLEVQKVVALKRKHNMPVFHPAREEDVISRLRSDAVKNGIEPDFIEDIYRVILRNSRLHQTIEMKQQGIRRGAKVLIAGGYGQMGSYFARFFESSGYEVRILAQDNWHEVKELCQDIDLALISVPINVTIDSIKKISPHLPQNCLLADLTSIKSEPLQEMLNSHNGPVIGLHPLFGPTCPTLDKQIIAITPGRDAEQCQWLIDQLVLWGAIIVNSDAEEHDEIMDIVQALRHFATFVFGQFLLKRKIDLHKTLEFSSPIYRLEMGMVGRLFAQDSELYAEIVFATPLRRKMLKEFVYSLNEQLEMLENNDKNLFIERFNETTKWFGSFSEQALRESTFIKKLIYTLSNIMLFEIIKQTKFRPFEVFIAISNIMQLYYPPRYAFFTSGLLISSFAFPLATISPVSITYPR
ncbi:bifunctional chorismate mutase/prephenate dehydrogenase [Candidatus Magnetoovum chiemensis]|nr:bifunctional chorismate mutase/prephenate dehydrogenase [Candidatus Magnetoovum chiemensis]